MAKKERILFWCLFLSTFVMVQKDQAAKPVEKKAKSLLCCEKDKYSAYLFVYFTGNQKEEEQIRFALSKDGYNFRALNQNMPVIGSTKISLTGGVRDPHILRGVEKQTYYMVATDMVATKGWDSNRGIVLLKSKNLIDWSSTAINIPTVFPEFKNVDRVWAPQTIYDQYTGKYMIYFSMRQGANDYDKIYYVYANKDFTALEGTPKQLFFSPDNKFCIDGDIVCNDGKYYFFVKTMDNSGSGIKVAVSSKLTEGYVLENKYLQQTADMVEGAGVFKLNNSNPWILMYDVYQKGRYQFTKSVDLENFKVIDQDVTMNFHPRHGTVMPITEKEFKALISRWGMPGDFEPKQAK